MATFLTTRRMAPELAARIDASVRGRARPNEGRAARSKALLVALARVAGVAIVIGVVLLVLGVRRSERRELERSRSALLESVRAARASVTERDLGAVGRVEAWLVRASEAYEGDFVADELRRPGAFSSVLARPSVYVRGPIAQFGSDREIAEAALASLKDSFLVCLLEPPAERTEKALLAKVRDSYSNGAESHSPNARRLRDAQIGLPFLLPPWGARVEAAKSEEDLAPLRELLEKAPIEGAKRALKASVLLFAMDEAGDADAKTPTELDGERPHWVRVGVVELDGAGKVLLRLRKRVDPSWVSQAKRPLYGGGIDGCALAFDVRAAAEAR
jgi:hypothetical protein